MPPKGITRKKAPLASTEGTATPQTPSLSEQLSYMQSPRPFKNPNYTKNLNRRAKNLKAMLGQERERERVDREHRRAERDQMLGVEEDGEARSKAREGTKEGSVDEDLPTYLSIEAPPSIIPARHYCDITGLEAPYTDPSSGLRYHDKSVYEVIRGLTTGAAKEYLSARGVNPIVK